MKTRMHLVLALALAAAYLAMGLRDLHHPGPYYDELYQVAPATAVLAGFPSGPALPTAFSFQVGDGYFPLFTNLGYLGALKSYVLLPAFAIYGLDIAAVRATTLALGALGLALAFLFCARFAGLPAALIAGVLLATDPSYLLHARQDWGPTALMFALKSLALYALWRWWTDGGAGWLALGSFSVGAGLYDKLNFAWFVLGIGAATVLLSRQPSLRRWRPGNLAIAIVSLLVGCAPLVIVNVLSPGWSLSTPYSASGDGSLGLVGQLASEAGFKLRLALGVIWGDIVPDLIFGAPVLSARLERISPLWVLLVVALSLYFGAVRRRWQPASYLRRAAFCLLASTLILLQVLLTPQAIGSHHSMMVYPFPQFFAGMVLAIPLSRPVVRARSLPFVRGLVVVLVLLTVSGQWLVTQDTFGRLTSNGARGNWSSSIYAVTQYLLDHANGQEVVAVDWGLLHPLLFVSKGELRVTEPPVIYDIHSAADTVEQRSRVREQLQRSEWFVLHSPKVTNFYRARAVFLEELAADGRQLEEQWFYEQDGSPYMVAIHLANAAARSGGGQDSGPAAAAKEPERGYEADG